VNSAESTHASHVEQFSGLTACHLFGHGLSRDRRVRSHDTAEGGRVIETLRRFAKIEQPHLHHRAAQCLGALLDLSKTEFRRLAVPLIVLLHDPNPEVRAATIDSVTMLYTNNVLDADRDIFERILELGHDGEYLDVRKAVAHALAHLPISDLVADLSEVADSVREKLATDIHFEVRAELAQPTMEHEQDT
jgi:HEAT repeats